MRYLRGPVNPSGMRLCYHGGMPAYGSDLAPTDLSAWLQSFDLILINTSGGKDSQVTLTYVHDLAQQAGVVDRMVTVHCDLGHIEWPETRELARDQVRHYGLPFYVVARDRNLLHQIEFERWMFPGPPDARFCTSDHNTSQVKKLMTRLVEERRPKRVPGQPKPRAIRILNCLGIRADESTERGKKDQHHGHL